MTVKEMTETLSALKKELQDKEIVVIAPNGLMFEPAIKFALKDRCVLQIDKENVDKVVIGFN
jgi:aromatic ring-opening dioxygenase LigB subunit